MPVLSDRNNRENIMRFDQDKYSRVELEELFDSFIDSTYGPADILGQQFRMSHVLYKMSPKMYEKLFYDFVYDQVELIYEA
jgi:hypothetical protein